MGKKEVYLIVWFDPTDGVVKSESLTFDDPTMHQYVNDLRAAMGEDFKPEYVRVFVCYEPRSLTGSMQLRFEEEGR